MLRRCLKHSVHLLMILLNNDPIKLSLRGVVSFSQLTIKIVSTFDVELIKAENADKYFANQILQSVKGRQTVSANTDKKRFQVRSFAYKGSFKTPSEGGKSLRALLFAIY